MSAIRSPRQYQVNPTLLDVLQTAGAKGEQFTIKEVLYYVRLYIAQRLLYDHLNPREIRCSNDPLEKAIGAAMFNLKDIPHLLAPNLNLVNAVERTDLLQTKQFDVPSISEKRKSFDAEDSNPKRQCSELFIAGSSPLYIRIPNSPLYDSSPESVWSIQGYETALAKDSSDDLWFLETDDELEVEVDEFDVEYDVVSEASSQHNEDFSDTESEVADVVAATILLCHTDSDVEFWADYSDTDNEGNDSSESDPEMTDGDKWKCRHCSAMNRPLLRFCQKCWQLRNDWLPDRRRPRRHPRRLRRTISAPNGHTAQQGLASMRKRKTSRSLIDFTLAENLLPDKCAQPNEEAKIGEAQVSSAMDCTADQQSCKNAGDLETTTLPCTSSTDHDVNQPSTSHQADDTHQPSTSWSEPLARPASQSSGETLVMEPSSSQESPVSRPHSSAAATPEWHQSENGDVACEREREREGDPGGGGGNLCTICQARPKNASLVHGKTGHQVCCYGCGVKLWERNKPCPVCRRSIQKVIQNFIV